MTRDRRYCAIVKTENGTIREMYACYDYCDFLEQLNNDLNACYYDWEIIKEWKVK